jgi:hypothetical protein
MRVLAGLTASGNYEEITCSFPFVARGPGIPWLFLFKASYSGLCFPRYSPPLLSLIPPVTSYEDSYDFNAPPKKSNLLI